MAVTKLILVFVSSFLVACGHKTPDPEPTAIETKTVQSEVGEERSKPDDSTSSGQLDEPSSDVVPKMEEKLTTDANGEVAQYPKGGDHARACKKNSDCVVTHVDGNCCKGCRARAMNTGWIEKVAAYCTSDRKQNCVGRRRYCKPQQATAACERNVCVLKTEADNRPIEIPND